jgi:adenosylcobyric acid synthase
VPLGFKVPEGKYYDPYFPGRNISMPPPLKDDSVTYSDGTKATVEDLERLRAAGLGDALTARAHAGQPILGICGGYQLLGERIEDAVESRRGIVAGLGLLPVATRFASEKVLRRRSGRSPVLATAAGGYEIRHGRVERRGGEPLLVGDDGEPDGCVAGSVYGTSWHAALEHDAFRRALLARVAAARGRPFSPGSGAFAAAREARLDLLGDLPQHFACWKPEERYIEAHVAKVMSCNWKL